MINSTRDQVQRPEANRTNRRLIEHHQWKRASERAVGRAPGIISAVVRARPPDGLAAEALLVGDGGSNAGTEGRFGQERGRSDRRLETRGDLVAVAPSRNAESGWRSHRRASSGA